MRTRIWITVAFTALLLLGAAHGVHAQVTLTTDKPVYSVGEIVHITAHNAGPENEELVSSPFFLIRNEDTGQCLMGCLGLPVVTTFLVGETLTLEWDTGDQPDEPGHHIVTLALSTGPSASYDLDAGTPSEPDSWSMLKARY